MTEISRREFVKNTIGVGIAGNASLPALQSIAVRPRTNVADPYALVDRELIPAIKVLPKMDLVSETLAQARNVTASPPLPAPALQPVDHFIPGPKGAPDVRVLVASPGASNSNPRPAFLHIHGGGYVSGRAELFVSRMQQIAERCSCVVVSVDYRLAPETHFPGSLEDNYAALRWLYSKAEKLGIDRQRIAIGGESAGGGHAAMLAMAARERGEIPILFQLLIYPMLDDRTGSSRPVPPHIGRLVWTPASNVFGWTSLLGVPAGSNRVPPGSVPARFDNLAGLPPAFIGVGSIDLFVDEDVDYARRLITAGVPSELHVVPGAYHGFDLLAPNASITARFTEYWMTALKRALLGL
jgi:acetyl esterase/lipase